jgi:GT2 family glycosyltransferase
VTTIAVCTGTYGGAEWLTLAKERAGASVDRQTRRATWVSSHHQSLHEARNNAAASLQLLDDDIEWLCFLDADDELDAGYIAAMATATERLEGDWLLQPATLGVYADGREDTRPVVIPTKPLLDGNYLVISTLIRRSQFERLGGFRDWPCYEDWDLWIRAHLDGARIRQVPAAILRVHVNETGRNCAARETQLRTYHAIRSQYLP